MQLSTASAGNQAVMSEDRPNQFLEMVKRGHARRTAVERLPPTILDKIDELAEWIAQSSTTLSLAAVKGELLVLASDTQGHAEQRHSAYLEQLAERLEGAANGNR